MSSRAPSTPDFAALEWFTSSFSGENGACVEVAGTSDGRVSLRDSKDRGGPKHVFTRREWSAFIAAVKAGEFGTGG